MLNANEPERWNDDTRRSFLQYKHQGEIILPSTN